MNTLPTRSRFSAALKQARLSKRWKQEDLARALDVNPRTAISWESGERIPSAGIVLLLCLTLTGSQEITADLLTHELFTSYFIDDLERQARTHEGSAFEQLATHGIEALDHLAMPPHPSNNAQKEMHAALPAQFAFLSPGRVAESRSPYEWQSDGQQPPVPIDQLFAVLDMLRRRPDLIDAASDFLREMASS